MSSASTTPAKGGRDLEYAEAVIAWALEHLDRVDLTHAQRRAVQRELRTALEMRSLIAAR